MTISGYAMIEQAAAVAARSWRELTAGHSREDVVIAWLMMEAGYDPFTGEDVERYAADAHRLFLAGRTRATIKRALRGRKE